MFATRAAGASQSLSFFSTPPPPATTARRLLRTRRVASLFWSCEGIRSAEPPTPTPQAATASYSLTEGSCPCCRCSVCVCVWGGWAGGASTGPLCTRGEPPGLCNQSVRCLPACLDEWSSAGALHSLPPTPRRLALTGLHILGSFHSEAGETTAELCGFVCNLRGAGAGWVHSRL